MLAILAILAVITVTAVFLAARSHQEAKRVKEQLTRLANFDRLTGLPDRHQLDRWLAEMLKESRRSTARVAVLFVELNRFDLLNETYGHEVGDALMVAAAKALRAVTRPNDLLVRYAGPQFVLTCPDVPDPSQAAKRADQILEAVQRPYEIGQDRIRLSASVGVTLTDQQYASADDVLLDAGVALSKAVEEGRGSVKMFDRSMRSDLTPSTAEHRLREALDRGEFWLLYLPVVDLRDNRLVGVEALLRWADPEVGLVNPGKFMQALDDTGLIVPVGNWVTREAARQARQWQDKYPDLRLDMTINVSPRQLMQSDFYERLLGAIEETSVDPSRLCLEITEGALMRDVEMVWGMLRQAKGKGIKLSLDDFGTGYSSLNYLRRFQVDVLKIDQSFVQEVEGSKEDNAIVGQIVGLAHALDITAVAEGVETPEQLAALRALGCNHAQGYYFCSPQPADVIEQFLVKGHIDRSDRPPTLTELKGDRATVVSPELR